MLLRSIRSLASFVWVRLGYRDMCAMSLRPLATQQLLRADLRNQLVSRPVHEVSRNLDEWARRSGVSDFQRRALQLELERVVREITKQT